MGTKVPIGLVQAHRRELRWRVVPPAASPVAGSSAKRAWVEFNLASNFLKLIEKEVSAAASGIPDPELRLREMARAHARRFARSHYAVERFFSGHSSIRHELRLHFIERRQGYSELFRATLGELQEAGRMRPLDLNLATIRLLAILAPDQGKAAHDSIWGPSSLEHWVEITVDMAMAALLIEPKPTSPVLTEDHELTILRLYQDIEGLILSDGNQEELASKTRKLRDIQEAEAVAMARHAHRRNHLPQGEGYALLEKADRLLSK